jgi:cob(I)alamin adenosyltransferase
MVAALERRIDEVAGRFPPINDFVIPGHDEVSAALDVARTTIRRAERESLSACPQGSLVLQYLNRLSDFVWALARWQEHGESLLSRKATGR